jgi:hypothetical protein
MVGVFYVESYGALCSYFNRNYECLAQKEYVVGFVDDLRPMGPSRRKAWLAARRVASILIHLGIQYAARKRRDVSQSPGAWAGSVVRVTKEGVFTLVADEKWEKFRSLISELSVLIEATPEALSRKRLEQIRG